MKIVYELEEIDVVARQILQTPLLKKIILFYAEMGAGKTTFIKALVKALGVKQNSSSPTFSLVNEYITNTKETIYHFDLYRIENEEEAYQIGLDEYFYSGKWCFIEWPEKTPNLIPIEHASIHISILEDGKRELLFKN